jgi:hypothetical protein
MIGVGGGFHERFEIGAIAHIPFTGGSFERVSDFTEEPAIIEVAFDVFEMAPEKGFVEAFFET